MKAALIAVTLISCILAPASAISLANVDCLSCHIEVDGEKFEQSIHGKNLCTSCHADAVAAPHAKKPGPVQCGSCHRLEQQIYANSDHGKAVAKGISEAASCKACHGENHYLKNSRDPQSPVHRGNIAQTCARCHSDEEIMRPYKLSQLQPYKSYEESVHGKAVEGGEIRAAVCTDCHGSHDLHSPNNLESKIYRFNVPTTCSKCHENIYKTYTMSIHAKGMLAGIKDAPVCTDCHGEHSILSPQDPHSSVHPSSIVKTCSHCHASEKIARKYGLPLDVTSTYLGSYHGIAFQYGTYTAANCASCHGFHDVLPSSDPRSSINPDNVGRTCGKCHPGAGEQLSKGSVHIRPSVKSDRIIFYVTTIYIVLIVLTIGGMLTHNILDLRKKMAARLSAVRRESIITRLGIGERIQHIVLFACFAALVYTGFAHKYPNAFFSYPFNITEAGPLVRKIIHRVAGIIFIILMSYHAIWMLGTAYGRRKLSALLPRWRDITDAIALVTFNLGLSRDKPKFARYSYIEKAEYWALMWGSFIMIITGLVLMFENISLQYLPKWLIDVMLVIHFFEAILATLAIIVWHCYWVIFDPDVYPMNWSWMTGKMTEKQLEEREEKKESSL